MRRATGTWIVWTVVLLLAACVAAARSGGATTIYEGAEVSADSLIVELDDAADTDAVLAELVEDTPLVRAATASLRTGRRVAVERSGRSPLTAPLSHVLVDLAPGTDLDEAIDALESLSGVEGAYPNHVFYPLYTPNDPGYATLQQNYRQIYVDEAWDLTRGAGAKIAVVDTGYRLAGMTDSVIDLDTGYDFCDGDEDTTDYIGHGTHVANTVAEATDNAIGMAGIAAEATILVCKVFPDYDGGAYESDIIDAINYAVEEGAVAINMSLGGAGSNPTTRNTLEDAREAGAVPVCASGNEGAASVDYPGGHEACLAVGSVNMHATGAIGHRSGFSNYGENLDMIAPGEMVFQETFYTGFGVGFFPFWGTSSAAPHVSGVIALMVGYVGQSDPDLIEQAIFETAQDIPPTGWDAEHGWGEIDAVAAVHRYRELVNDLPVAAFTGELVDAYKIAYDGSPSTDSDGTVVQWEWDFGDGVGGSGAQTRHTYDGPGDYLVRLRVTDDKGGQDIAEKTLTLTEDDGDSGGDDDDSGCGCDL